MKVSPLLLAVVAACTPTGPKENGTHLGVSTAPPSARGPAPASAAPSSPASPAAPAASTASTAPAASTASTAPADATGWRHVQTPKYEGVVATSWAHLPYGMTSIGAAKVEGAWALDDATVARAESVLGLALKKVERGREIVPRLAIYKRQYFGFVAGGKRYVYINAFCSDRPAWRESTVLVKDGGSCYFQAVFNVDAGAYTEVQVNGQA